MKRLRFLLLGLLFPLFLHAQIYKPVTWRTSIERLEGNELFLVATATIEEGWHLYSQDVSEGGPIPTSFVYDDLDGDITFEGRPFERDGRVVYDSVFEMKIKYFEREAIFKQKVTAPVGFDKISGIVEFMVCDDKRCLSPTEVELEFSFVTDENLSVDPTEKIAQNDSSEPAHRVNSFDTGLFTIFMVAFFSGFLALLTPCVFPMIPLTVSFFINKGKSRKEGIANAVLYGISIVVVYLLLGGFVVGVFGASSLNALATNVFFNLIFFVLLVVFAISLLGAFEIRLPNSWANKIDSQSTRKGIVGIFFMALALAIVSFSCTGPIVGTLLVESASKGGWAPIVGMLGFSLAIAIPFTVFALFPGWLKSLPKSGGWLNTVKVVLGFFELALAFKFLSQADLVLQLHLFEREIFIAIWISVFGALTLYLLGKIRLAYDDIKGKISIGRLLFGLCTMAFTIYLIPGLWGAPLNLISAFPPPIEYSESPYGVGNDSNLPSLPLMDKKDLPEGSHLLPPFNILVFDNYEDGLAYAKKVNKPMLIDFTGWACVNCRKMEQNVWSRPEVLDVLKNKVVLISLYVDDKRKLDSDETLYSTLKPSKTLEYVGQKWSEFQILRYNSNSQPFYAMTRPNEENLVEPIGYTSDSDEFYNWLKLGMASFSL